MGSLDHLGAVEGVLVPMVQMANGLTAINTALLLTTGVVAGYAVHLLSLNLVLMSSVCLHAIVGLGLLFLAVQCIEYSHLYWCIHTYALSYILPRALYNGLMGGTEGPCCLAIR